MCCHLITLFKRVFHQRDTLPQITSKETNPSHIGLLTGHKEMGPPGWPQAQAASSALGPQGGFPQGGKPVDGQGKDSKNFLWVSAPSEHGRGWSSGRLSALSPATPKLGQLLQQALPSCSFSVVPTFLIFLGDFMKRGKMVRKPRMSTNLWQLSVPSGPIMAWSSTFNALLREIFFSLQTNAVSCGKS